MSFVIYSCKTGKCCKQNILINLQKFCQILILTLWFVTLSFLLAKIAQIFQTESWFSWKGERIDFDIIGKPTAKIFPHYSLSFLILAIFREKRAVKVGLKVQNLGPFLFYVNSNPPYFFQTMFLFARVLPLMRILAMFERVQSNFQRHKDNCM